MSKMECWWRAAPGKIPSWHVDAAEQNRALEIGAIVEEKARGAPGDGNLQGVGLSVGVHISKDVIGPSFWCRLAEE